MNRCNRHHAWAVLLVVGGIASAGADEVDSELWLGDGQPGQAEAWRSNGYRSSATQVVFQPLADMRIEVLKRRNAAVGNRRLQVGVSRQLASEAIRSDLAGLAWVAVEGGLVALVDIVSPGAKGLRVALKPSSLPPATQIRVAGDDGVILVTSADEAGSLADGYGLFWTAVTAGEWQRLEFFMPAGIDTAGTVPDIRAAAHLLVSMGAPGGFPLGAVTLSQPCQINAVCPDDELGQAYVNARNAVGWMNFMAGGESSVCTGTLLADMDTSTTIPWFYSAHHCISSQADANTLTTFWRREASTCDGTDEGDAIQVDGGAQLVYATSNTDAALFRLNLGNHGHLRLQRGRREPIDHFQQAVVRRRRLDHDPPAKSCWRHASNSAIATVLDRLRLRLPGTRGNRSVRSADSEARSSAGNPRVSGPNSKASPGWNRGVSWRVAPRVLKANSRGGATAVVNASRFL
jgi:lysyl endopeptidase